MKKSFYYIEYVDFSLTEYVIPSVSPFQSSDYANESPYMHRFDLLANFVEWSRTIDDTFHVFRELSWKGFTQDVKQ